VRSWRLPAVRRVGEMRLSPAACLIAALAALGRVAQSQDSLPPPAPPPDIRTLPTVSVQADPRRQRLTIEFPPEELPAAAGMMSMRTLSPHQALIPLSGTIYSIKTEVVDSAGRALPRALLHHVNLADPTRRELFLPISLHLFAASKETPPVDVPRLLLGVPLERGQRLLLSGMLGNDSPVAYHAVRIRVILGYRPAGRLFPVWQAYPWVMDAMFPLGNGPSGSKAFDLPPGLSTKSWEASPAIAGYVLGVGGHVHDHAVAVDFTDVTTGDTLWHGVPKRDSSGRIEWLPVRRFYNWHSLGVHIEATHTYRITVMYDNPTGQVLHDGGMGAVAGLFIPDENTHWPQVDTSSALYQRDLASTFVAGSDMMMDMGHAASTPNP
jgi:hypothetical protein